MAAVTTSSNSKDTFITKGAITRIIKDIKELRNNPLASHGIFYQHDSDDMLTGRALIIGPKDTPYSNGMYYFKIKMPTNYPHEPPKFSFYTNDGKIRMHPNLYKNKKVCLDILNTWYGEAWTGCQSLSSVLLTICSILTKNPLTHEPGCDERHKDYFSYTELVRFNNFKIAINDMMARKDIIQEFSELHDIAVKHILDNVENINSDIDTANEKYHAFKDKYPHLCKDNVVFSGIYAMDSEINYDKCKTMFNDLVDSLKNCHKKKN